MSPLQAAYDVKSKKMSKKRLEDDQKKYNSHCLEPPRREHICFISEIPWAKTKSANVTIQ